MFILHRTIIALGFNISMDKPPSRIRTIRLSNEPFLQSNGYKPAPLDLASIELNAKMEELVDRLAENTHNVWARERISQVRAKKKILHIGPSSGKCSMNIYFSNNKSLTLVMLQLEIDVSPLCFGKGE